MTHHQVVLYGGLAMMAIGSLVLLGVVLGVACGIFVRMFEITSGHAQFARNSRHRSRHNSRRNLQRAPLPPTIASILSDGASDDTADLPVFDGDRHG